MTILLIASATDAKAVNGIPWRGTGWHRSSPVSEFPVRYAVTDTDIPPGFVRSPDTSWTLKSEPIPCWMGTDMAGEWRRTVKDRPAAGIMVPGIMWTAVRPLTVSEIIAAREPQAPEYRTPEQRDEYQRQLRGFDLAKSRALDTAMSAYLSEVQAAERAAKARTPAGEHWPPDAAGEYRAVCGAALDRRGAAEATAKQAWREGRRELAISLGFTVPAMD